MRVGTVDHDHLANLSAKRSHAWGLATDLKWQVDREASSSWKVASQHYLFIMNAFGLARFLIQLHEATPLAKELKRYIFNRILAD